MCVCVCVLVCMCVSYTAGEHNGGLASSPSDPLSPSLKHYHTVKGSGGHTPGLCYELQQHGEQSRHIYRTGQPEKLISQFNSRSLQEDPDW